LEDYESFELSRYKDDSIKRFELTLIISDDTWFDSIQKLRPEHALIQRTDETRSRCFLFFPDNHAGELIPVLDKINSVPGLQIMINGRERPYFEELWLPLIQLIHSQ